MHIIWKGTLSTAFEHDVLIFTWTGKTHEAVEIDFSEVPKSNPISGSAQPLIASDEGAALQSTTNRLRALRARKFTRYKDLPPLPVEDRERLKKKLVAMLTVDDDKRKQEKHDWYMSMAHHAP